MVLAFGFIKLFFKDGCVKYFRPIRPNANDGNFRNHAGLYFLQDVTAGRCLIISYAYDIRFYFSQNSVVAVFFVAEKRAGYCRRAPYVPKTGLFGIPRQLFFEAQHISVPRNRNKEFAAERARRAQKEIVSGVDSVKYAKRKNSFFSFARSRTAIICPCHLFQAADRVRLRQKSEVLPADPPFSPQSASTNDRLLLVPLGGEKSSQALRCLTKPWSFAFA